MAEEMAQQAKLFASKPDDPRLILISHPQNK